MNHELGFTLCGCNVLIESTKNPKLTYRWKFGRSSIQAPGVMRFVRAMFGSTHWARWKKYKKRVHYFTWHIMVDIWLVVIMLSVPYRKWCHYSTTSIYFHYNDTMFILDIVMGSFFQNTFTCSTLLPYQSAENQPFKNPFKKSLGSTFSTYRRSPQLISCMMVPSWDGFCWGNGPVAARRRPKVMPPSNGVSNPKTNQKTCWWQTMGVEAPNKSGVFWVKKGQCEKSNTGWHLLGMKNGKLACVWNSSRFEMKFHW